MAGVSLYDYQVDALGKMHNGCILCGGVGSGKSRTALAYFYTRHGGQVNTKEYVFMTDKKIPTLYIITTAQKRDKGEWEVELLPFLLSTDRALNPYHNRVIIDSWNNIEKHKNAINSFFIFDEQRVVGNGPWVQSFLKIAKNNEWILLSATPGDKWEDYIPVFIANGFYENKTQFTREHLIYSRWTKYPKIDRYLNVGRLMRLRDRILVDMEFERHTISHHVYTNVEYDKETYTAILKNRWNVYKNEPITNAAELCRLLRKLVNLDPSRFQTVVEIVENHPRSIIFYNYDYELDALIELFATEGIEYSQWNGHKHQPVPEGDEWVYLVQYNAGAEGWNCIKTDTIIFFSQNYSYKIMAQAAGRIDRLNTPYTHLYYYHLKSSSSIDNAIYATLKKKKKFNESRFLGKMFEKHDAVNVMVDSKEDKK